MFDLHTHSLLSDGALLPSEVAVRYMAAGYKVIAISDHADYSNIQNITNSILQFTNKWPENSPITVLPGIELTHLPPEQFKDLVAYARKARIKIVIAHGESPVEPVITGTNRAAIEAGVDILAHPGHITEEVARLAKEKGVFLEVSCRNGHSQTNPHVVKLALETGAKLILGSDSHKPEDILSIEAFKKTGIKAGLDYSQIEIILENTKKFLKTKGVNI